MASTKVSLKLWIDTNNNRVLFAEAPKDFIDFLSNLLSQSITVPIRTIISLVTKDEMEGCIGNIFESIDNYNLTDHITAAKILDLFQFPANDDGDDDAEDSDNDDDEDDDEDDLNFHNYNDDDYDEDNDEDYKINDDDDEDDDDDDDDDDDYGDDDGLMPPKLFKCKNSCNYITHDESYDCPKCRSIMNVAVTYFGIKDVESSQCGRELEVQVGRYIVMDDLVVHPMPTISSFITLLEDLNVKEISSLQERVVEFGMEEGIKLLKASLQIKNVLTSVFLENMGA